VAREPLIWTACLQESESCQRAEDVRRKRRVSRSKATRRCDLDAVLVYSTAFGLHFIRALYRVKGPVAQASCELGHATPKYFVVHLETSHNGQRIWGSGVKFRTLAVDMWITDLCAGS
jgi:hypothetical protein